MGLDVLLELGPNLGPDGGFGTSVGRQTVKPVRQKICSRGLAGEELEGDLLGRQFCISRMHGPVAVVGGVSQDRQSDLPGLPDRIFCRKDSISLHYHVGVAAYQPSGFSGWCRDLQLGQDIDTPFGGSWVTGAMFRALPGFGHGWRQCTNPFV